MLSKEMREMFPFWPGLQSANSCQLDLRHCDAHDSDAEAPTCGVDHLRAQDLSRFPHASHLAH